MGAALPVLEALRRRTDFSNLPAYLDDFLVGGILLGAAWSVCRGWRYGRAALVAAWGIVVGGGYYSFFGQVARMNETDISGLPGVWVVAIKGVMMLVALVSLASAIGTASATPATITMTRPAPSVAARAAQPR